MSARVITQAQHISFDAAARIVSCAHCTATVSAADLVAAGVAVSDISFCFLAGKFIRRHWQCPRPFSVAVRRELGQVSDVIDCPRCDGSGLYVRLPGDPGTSCGVCSGTGRISEAELQARHDAARAAITLPGPVDSDGVQCVDIEVLQ